ncbi:MAG TPA: GGDEF domain-containing protein, partial [Solirubrobacteraceae bacterium]|jgi:diguanylate cyclase (GGDEF)-like protein
MRIVPAKDNASAEPRWLGAVACFAMGVVVSAVNVLITGPAVASHLAFELDAVASAFFLALLIAFKDRLPDVFYELVLVVCTGLITLTIGLNPRHTGNEAYYLLIVLYSSYFFTRPRAVFQIALVIAAYGVVTFLRVHNGSAGPRWLNLSGVLAVVSGVVMMLRSRMEELIDSLNEAALTDPLTGLLNRRAFEMRIHEEAARSARQSTPLSMLALDIDHFKRVNDCFGHPTGDVALASIGRVIEQTAREIDVVARVGGEEFSVLLVDADLGAAAIVAERIRKAVETTSHGDIGELTISIGVACLSLEAEAPAVMLQRDADRVLYVAKDTGRNRVVSCATELKLHAVGPAPTVRPLSAIPA